jgi:hypothetical protein
MPRVETKQIENVPFKEPVSVPRVDRILGTSAIKTSHPVVVINLRVFSATNRKCTRSRSSFSSSCLVLADIDVDLKRCCINAIANDCAAICN